MEEEGERSGSREMKPVLMNIRWDNIRPIRDQVLLAQLAEMLKLNEPEEATNE